LDELAEWFRIFTVIAIAIGCPVASSLSLPVALAFVMSLSDILNFLHKRTFLKVFFVF
jgi:hypothetical protein